MLTCTSFTGILGVGAYIHSPLALPVHTDIVSLLSSCLYIYILYVFNIRLDFCTFAHTIVYNEGQLWLSKWLSANLKKS